MEASRRILLEASKFTGFYVLYVLSLNGISYTYYKSLTEIYGVSKIEKAYDLRLLYDNSAIINYLL